MSEHSFPVDVGVLDTSPRARTIPDKELLSLFYDGEYYRQVKKYKGYFCLGAVWEKYKPEGLEEMI